MKRNSPAYRSAANRTAWLLALFIFVLALSTHPPDLAPGFPAQIANAVAGAYYLPVVTHYLYLTAARLFMAALPGTPLFKLVLFSAVFAALSAMLFFRLMLRAPAYAMLTEVHAARLAEARLLAAGLAAALLILSTPFWTSATRPQGCVTEEIGESQRLSGR